MNFLKKGKEKRMLKKEKKEIVMATCGKGMDLSIKIKALDMYNEQLVDKANKEDGVKQAY